MQTNAELYAVSFQGLVSALIQEDVVFDVFMEKERFTSLQIQLGALSHEVGKVIASEFKDTTFGVAPNKAIYAVANAFFKVLKERLNNNEEIESLSVVSDDFDCINFASDVISKYK